MKYFFACFLAIGLVAACTSSEPKVETSTEELPPHQSTARLAIYIRKDGTIYLNEKIATPEEVEAALKKHAEKGGTVFYSRADRNSEPSEAAMKVIDLIAKEKLIIQFYTDSTFRHIVKF